VWQFYVDLDISTIKIIDIYPYLDEAVILILKELVAISLATKNH
jgi:hypothetical protein